MGYLIYSYKSTFHIWLRYTNLTLNFYICILKKFKSDI